MFGPLALRNRFADDLTVSFERIRRGTFAVLYPVTRLMIRFAPYLKTGWLSSASKRGSLDIQRNGEDSGANS